jgi:hypothetical protein
LGHQPAIVAVDGEAGEAVPFAEDEAIGRGILPEFEDIRTQPYRRGERFRPKGIVERAIVPAIKPDPDRARRVEKSLGDELAFARRNIDLITRRRLAGDPVD